MTAQRLPSATVHAFEVVPRKAEQRRAATAGADRIVVNGIGLSDRDGPHDGSDHLAVREDEAALVRALADG